MCELEEIEADLTLGFVTGNLQGEEELVDGVEEEVEGVRDTEERAEDAVEEVLLTLVW